MRLALHAALGFALASASGIARAACQDGFSTCIDADTHWPHAGPAFFDVVGSTATTAPGAVGFGWATTYLSRPVVLLLPSSQTGGTEVAAVRHLWNATFLFSYGLTDRLEANVAIPTTLYRDGTGVSTLTQQSSSDLSHTSLRDLRVGATFALLPEPSPDAAGFTLASRFQLALPTGDETAFSGDRTVVAVPSLAGAYRQSRLILGAEIGARLRGTSDLVGTRMGSQLLASFGMGSELLNGHELGVMLEAVLLPTLVEQYELSSVSPQSGRTVAGDRRFLMPTEWRASVRTAELMSGDLSLSLGLGGSLGLTGESGVTSPAFRTTFSVRYAPRVRARGE